MHSAAGGACANLSQYYDEYYGLEDSNADEGEGSPAGAHAMHSHGILPTVFEADAEDDDGEWQLASKHGIKVARAASTFPEVRRP